MNQSVSISGNDVLFQNIRFKGHAYYDLHSRRYNLIHLPSLMTHFFPFIHKHRLKYEIRCFSDMEKSAQYLDNLDSPPVILQLFIKPEDKSATKQSTFDLINLVKSRTFYGAVSYCGISYYNSRSKNYNIIHLPPAIFKDFPDLKKHKLQFELICFPTILHVRQYLSSLTIPPLFLQFSELINDNFKEM